MSEQYKNINQLTEEVNSLSKKLELGVISFNEISEMLYLTRELTERLVVLRYKALEQNTEEYKAKVNKEYNKFSEISKKEQAEKAEELSKKQTNLMDAISEQEVVTDGFEVKEDTSISFGNLLFGGSNDKLVDNDKEDKKNSSEDLIDEIISDNIEETEKNTEEFTTEISEEELNTNSLEEEVIEEEDKIEKTSDLLENQDIEDKMEEETQVLNDNLSSEDDIRLLDKLEASKADTQTLAQTLKLTPLEDLKTAISINQKFVVINDLFDRDADRYNNELEQLNQLEDWDEATEYLSLLSDEFSWDENNPAVENFKTLVQRRYL